MSKYSKEEIILQLKELEKQLNRKPTKRDSAKLYYHSRRLFGTWNNMMQEAGYKVKFYQQLQINELSTDFYYFLGLVITDGHIVTKNGIYKVMIYTSYPEEVLVIQRLLKKLFSYNAGISQKMGGYNKKPNFEIRICSKKLVQILTKEWEIPSGAKSRIVTIPNKILSCKSKEKIAFLKGVIDGDGSISSNGIKIASGSTRFLQGMKELLNQLDIKTGNVLKDNKNTETYALWICRKTGREKIKNFYKTKGYNKRKTEAVMEKL